jgi:hypothetical protein
VSCFRDALETSNGFKCASLWSIGCWILITLVVLLIASVSMFRHSGSRLAITAAVCSRPAMANIASTRTSMLTAPDARTPPREDEKHESKHNVHPRSIVESYRCRTVALEVTIARRYHIYSKGFVASRALWRVRVCQRMQTFQHRTFAWYFRATPPACIPIKL